MGLRKLLGGLRRGRVGQHFAEQLGQLPDTLWHHAGGHAQRCETARRHHLLGMHRKQQQWLARQQQGRRGAAAAMA